MANICGDLYFGCTVLDGRAMRSPYSRGDGQEAPQITISYGTFSANEVPAGMSRKVT